MDPNSHYKCCRPSLSTLLIITIMLYILATTFEKVSHYQMKKTHDHIDKFHNHCAMSLHDAGAVRWVREGLTEPSNKPYNLATEGKKRRHLPSQVRDHSQYGQMEIIIDRYLKGRKNGRFLEVGANDGEQFSNSLVLEYYYNWTGVLVEPDKASYLKLLKKNRPLNWWHWDLITIDVEGYEPEVLLSIPWNRCTIDVLQIECNECALTDGRETGKRHFLKRFMQAVGYVEAEYFELDFIYIKKSSELQ